MHADLRYAYVHIHTHMSPMMCSPLCVLAALAMGMAALRVGSGAEVPSSVPSARRPLGAPDHGAASRGVGAAALGSHRHPPFHLCVNVTDKLSGVAPCQGSVDHSSVRAAQLAESGETKQAAAATGIQMHAHDKARTPYDAAAFIAGRTRLGRRLGAPGSEHGVRAISVVAPLGITKVSFRSNSRVYATLGLLLLTVFGPLCLMMPRFQGGDNPNSQPGSFTHRVPPAWSPEGEFGYSFRAYVQDIQLWLMLTDLQPHQQAAAIVL